MLSGFNYRTVISDEKESLYAHYDFPVPNG